MMYGFALVNNILPLLNLLMMNKVLKVQVSDTTMYNSNHKVGYQKIKQSKSILTAQNLEEIFKTYKTNCCFQLSNKQVFYYE
ncbi:MAG: hypothetical protein JWQ09_5386 [Segetibacter sp.]|nr:hypothetical protein [Segetibacter sp.]